MKQNYNPQPRLLTLLCVFMLLASPVYAQLSGSYTIDPTKSASSTNYQNWASAIGDLLSGSRTDGGSTQGPGISASVNFTVYDTIYNANPIEITAITGSNPSRRIVFKSAGGKSSKCMIKVASSTSSTNDFVLSINGADYLTFQNIGFERTGTSAYSTVVMLGNTASNNIFNGCFFKGKKENSTSSLGFNRTIGTCFYIASTSDSTVLQNSRLLYGYNGLYCAGACKNNYIYGNTIDSSGSSAIYMASQTALLVENNTCNVGDFGANLGHYTSYGMRIEGSTSPRIMRNKIYMSAVNAQVVRGIMISTCTSTAGAPAMVYNNWIVNGGGSSDCTGLAVNSSSYVNCLYNNVLVTSALTNGAAYFHYANISSYVRLLNNNFINKGAGFAYSVGTNTADLDSVDYNNAYASGTYIGKWGGTDYTSFSAWKSASSKDANSISIDPGYNSTRDLHVSNIGLNGKAFKYPWITMDIDNEVRDTTNPDIGADEFFPIANDGGITSVDSPMVFCAGTHNVRIKFQNYGYDTLKSIQIRWQINGVGQTNYNWTGIVAPGVSSSSLILGSYTFNANTPYTIRVWTVNPNNATDGKKSNDTLTIIRYPAMSGTYKISDSLNADFKSFNSAIGAFTERGICGPLKFMVGPGVYNEQITLVQLPGMNSTNTITFEGTTKDSSRVLVTLPSTTATGNNNATIQLRGADYITFKYITFERTGTNPFGHVVHILNGSNYNRFYNCAMRGLKLVTANTTAYNIWSDQGQDDYNEIVNCNIKFGQNGILYTGTTTTHETGTVIKGNVFDSAFNYSVQVLYNDGIDVSNNTFLKVITPIAGNYSLQLNDCDGAIKVNANQFLDQGTESSIYLANCNGTSNSTGVISNNMINKGFGKGITLDVTEFQTVAFNTMYFTQAVSSSIAVNITISSSNDVLIKNNIIFMEGGQALFVPNPTSVTACDYNNYIVKGGQFSYYGATYNTFTDHSIGTGRDANSKTINPFFKSSSDLHIFNPLLKGSGSAITGINTDFDGESRNSTNPDIGADEFKLMDEDAGIVEMTGPTNGNCAGVNNIVVVIKNYGDKPLTSADINWTVQNNPQTVYKWTGTLNTNELDTVTIGTYNFVGNLNPKFSFWTTIPNGVTDPIIFNDSLTLNRSVRSLPVANAGQDFTICSGDIAVIGANAVNGHTYEWTDLGGNVLASTAKLTINPKVNSTYILEVINTTFGCKKRDTVVVSVNPVPVANAGADKTICYGNSTQIGAASQAGFTYDWSSSVGSFSSNVANPTVQPLQSTYYYLTKTIVATGCLDTDTVLVNIAFPPSASVTGPGSSCDGESKNYQANPSAGNTYLWDVTGGQIISGQSTTSINIIWNAPGSGKVTLIQSNQASCKDTVDYNVLVIKNPTAKFVVKEDCIGTSTQFTDSSSDANVYFWKFGDGKSSVQRNPFHTYDSAKTYNVQFIVTGSGNCADTVNGNAVVFPMPNTDFDFTKTSGLTYSFEDKSTIASGTVAQWTWDFGDGNSSTTQDPNHQYAYSYVNQTLNVQLCTKSDKGCGTCFTKVLSVTLLNQVNADFNLKVYPNPNNGAFSIEASVQIESIELVNALGQVVEVKAVNDSKINLDMTHLSAGVYTLKISINGEWGYYSVVIQ